MLIKSKFYFSFLILFSLTGCSAPNLAPVTVAEQTLARSKIKYMIQEDDTLPQIARRTGCSVEELCLINNLDKNKPNLKPGKVLSLKKPPALLNKKPKLLVKKSESSSIFSLRRRKTAEPEKNQKNRKVAIKPASAWIWPVSGEVTEKFNPKTSLGIYIANKSGSDILAARDGTVAYCGNALSSYGNLIVIKHDEHYLSAYAHNKNILVFEGQKVKAGEKIAELGTKLQFQIRCDGQPIDPILLLPAEK